MARFSGRVIVPNVAIGAAVLVRPSRVRSAQRRGDRVGVGIVLHHDEHALGVVEVRAYALDTRRGSWPAPGPAPARRWPPPRATALPGARRRQERSRRRPRVAPTARPDGSRRPRPPGGRARSPGARARCRCGTRAGRRCRRPGDRPAPPPPVRRCGPAPAASSTTHTGDSRVSPRSPASRHRKSSAHTKRQRIPHQSMDLGAGQTRLFLAQAARSCMAALSRTWKR